MLPVSAMIHIPKAQEVFDPEGQPLPGVDGPQWAGYLERSFQQLFWWAEAAQRQRFFDLWALKESFIKATGLGLAQSLKSFAFELMPDALVQTHPNQVALRHQWFELKRREPFALPSQLKLYCEIKLVTEPLPDFAHPQPENLHVQSYFGRLNDEYRFGLSLIYSNALPNVQISMTLASIKSLLAVSLAD